MICIVIVLIIALWAIAIRGMLNYLAKRLVRGLANG